MNNSSKLISSTGRKIAAITFTLVFFTAIAYAQDKLQPHSHSSHKQGEARPQDDSHDHSKMDHSNHKKADTKMSCSQVSTSKSCCSSESNTVDEAKAEHEKSWNAVCPVMGNEIDPKVKTVEYKEKTIGFCCPGCIEKFSKNPEKYLKKLTADGKEIIGS